MSFRFNSSLNRSFQQNDSLDSGSIIKPSALSNRSFQADANQDKYDYNPNIRYKTKNPDASSKLNKWNITDNASESSKNRDDGVSSNQYSNRSRDVVTVPKGSQVRAATEERAPPSNRPRDVAALLEIAQYKQKQALAEQEAYRQELKAQMQAKQKREHDERVHDLKFNNSGLLIGEVNQGLDIDQYAKNMKIRQNQDAIKKALNRSFTNQERSVSVQSIRNNNTYDRSNLDSSYIQSSLIDERDEDGFDQVEKYTPEYHQRRIQKQAKKGDQTSQGHNVRGYPQYNEDSSDSKLQLQRVHHDKLKKDIENQQKRHEEYTAKLFNEQQSKKNELKEALDAQVARNQFKQRAELYKEKEQQSHNKSYDGYRPSPSSTQPPIDKAWESKNVLVSEIEKKYKAQAEAKQNRQSSGIGSRVLDRDGRYKRLIDDTVKRIITRHENVTNHSKRDSKASSGRK